MKLSRLGSFAMKNLNIDSVSIRIRHNSQFLFPSPGSSWAMVTLAILVSAHSEKGFELSREFGPDGLSVCHSAFLVMASRFLFSSIFKLVRAYKFYSV